MRRKSNASLTSWASLIHGLDNAQVTVGNNNQERTRLMAKKKTLKRKRGMRPVDDLVDFPSQSHSFHRSCLV